MQTSSYNVGAASCFKRFCGIALLLLLLPPPNLSASGPDNVLLVVNDSSSISQAIGAYYQKKRKIPEQNVCRIRTAPRETIPRQVYDREIAAPIGRCLTQRKLSEKILYIVTTLEVPLRIEGAAGRDSDVASVDSELTLLYSAIKGRKLDPKGPVQNPFFGKLDNPFTHPVFPMYLVTRLAAYDLETVKAMIDRALVAENRGKFVLDLRGDGRESGDSWLRNAATLLPQDRVIIDESETVLTRMTGIIGFASWGSNDPHRKTRTVNIQWLPGGIATEYVSTNARTFIRPPPSWNIGSWNKPETFFAGAPQSMTADYLAEGATGASGHVFEPYLSMTPRPDYLFPAYFAGRNLAESFYVAIPALSWQNVVLGDPLCRLIKPAR